MTIKPRQGDVADPGLLEKVPPEVRVSRVPFLDVTAWERKPHAAARKLGALPSPDAGKQPTMLDRFLRSTAAFVRSCLYFPDEAIGWVPFGLREALRLHRAEKFAVVYTTSPPGSTLLIGFFLKLFTGVRWVAEFRDPWYPSDRPLRRRLERWLHALILRKADTLLAVTDGYAEELRSTYGVRSPKVAVVRNGFDEADFRVGLNGDRSFFPKGYIHLTHIGTIYPHSGGRFFPALRELVREFPDVKQRLRINIIGYPDGETFRYSREEDLRDIVTIRSFVNHTDALLAMRSSACLLLFYGDPYFSRVCVPGKIYEYLRVGRPIFALSVEGGLKQIIEEGNAGWVVHPDDVQGIKQRLRALAFGDQERLSQCAAAPEFVEQFRYDRLAGKLAEVLDQTVSHGK
jgi:glycosyltransferase involved in cell wall biosynthesis